MRARRITLLAAIATAWLAAVAQAAPLDDEERARRWRADLDQLAEQLPELHIEPFHAVGEATWRREIERLRESVPELSESDLLFELQRLVAMLGDGHTQVLWQRGDVPLTMYPLRLQWFADGLFVTAAPQADERLVRCKLVAVNNHAVDEIEPLLRPYLSVDNEVQAKRQLAQLILYAELLDHIGVVHVDHDPLSGDPPPPLTARFKFQPPGGDPFSYELTPQPSLEGIIWKQGLSDEDRPLYLRHPQTAYFAQYLPSEPVDPAATQPSADEPAGAPTRDSAAETPPTPKPNVLFFQYNSCDQRGDLPFADFQQQVFALCDRAPVDRLIIDLRHNGGGNSAILDPFITELKRREELNQVGRLFVIIGPRTFSSAVLNAMRLDRETNAILTGEPTGGRPNHYGEVKFFELRQSRLTVTYSTKFFRTTDGDPPTIAPDLPIEPTGADYFAGRDPVFEAIVDWDPDGPGPLDLGEFGDGTARRPRFGE